MLKDSWPAGLNRLNDSLRLELRYEPEERAAMVFANHTPGAGMTPNYRILSGGSPHQVHSFSAPARISRPRKRIAYVSIDDVEVVSGSAGAVPAIIR